MLLASVLNKDLNTSVLGHPEISLDLLVLDLVYGKCSKAEKKSYTFKLFSNFEHFSFYVFK